MMAEAPDYATRDCSSRRSRARGIPSIPELAASYALRIAKSRAFIDGDKGTALVAATAFLARNGLRITASEIDATVAMLAVAEGKINGAQLARWLADHTEKLARKPRRPK
jgi:death-on-curing protein